jgi:hypothetical protein
MLHINTAWKCHVALYLFPSVQLQFALVNSCFPARQLSGMHVHTIGCTVCPLYWPVFTVGYFVLPVSYAGCLKKSFTTLKVYITLFRGHVLWFELS